MCVFGRLTREESVAQPTQFINFNIYKLGFILVKMEIITKT